MVSLERTSRPSENVEELRNTRYSGNQYRSNGQNMIMRAGVDAVNQQRELGPAAEEFARTFEKHTMKLAAAAKSQAKNQRLYSPQLPGPLIESSFPSFPNSISSKRKMAARELGFQW